MFGTNIVFLLRHLRHERSMLGGWMCIWSWRLMELYKWFGEFYLMTYLFEGILYCYKVLLNAFIQLLISWKYTISNANEFSCFFQLDNKCMNIFSVSAEYSIRYFLTWMRSDWLDDACARAEACCVENQKIWLSKTVARSWLTSAGDFFYIDFPDQASNSFHTWR